uniref:GTP-binding protein 1 n=1 Tax=Aceria tosichella TaxID=561515 RepID=A0A6G1SM22_9ACAR
MTKNNKAASSTDGRQSDPPSQAAPPAASPSSSNGECKSTTDENGDCNGGHDSLSVNSIVETLRKKLEDGQGECIYKLCDPYLDTEDGLTEEQLSDAIMHLTTATERLDADYVLLRQIKSSKLRVINEYLIRSRAPDDDFQEIRVAVVGNVDAGKSTLLGVLTYGELDNGRGLARLKLFRHKHEIETGRTSSVGNDILGFDSRGQIVNETNVRAGNHLNWTTICRKSAKVITFIDLAGHERYLKTTIFGMTGNNPDFVMLIVGANSGIVGMTKEHLGLALALNVPVYIIVTKVDMCPANVLADTLNTIQRLLKSPSCRKIPVMVATEEDVITSATNFATERLCPIFQISSVTGTNLNLLKMFLNLLMSRTPKADNEAACYVIDDIHQVPGVGTVVSGLISKGSIKVNEVLYLGPDSLGHYQRVSIRSIHRKRLPVTEVRSGQTASFALKKVRRDEVRKGMVMLQSPTPPLAYWEFTSEILILHHATTISVRYQAVIHCGSIRQTAQILDMNAECLRTGDKASVRFRFIKNPEYLRLGQKMIFREGRTKAIGTIVALEVGSPPPSAKDKAAKREQNAARQKKTTTTSA